MEIAKETSNPPTQNIMKKFPEKSSAKKNTPLVIGSLVIVLAGVLTGWLLSGQSMGKTTTNTGSMESTIISENEFGIENGNVSDKAQEAEGILREGGIEGEGTHHLERTGGVSQNVYLTSTTLDLQSFVDKKVQIWGETLSGIKAGWLMDVVKIKVLE